MEIHLLNTFAQTHGLTTENPVTLRPGKIPHFERTCRELGIHIPRRMRQQGPSLRSCQLADLLAIKSLLWGPLRTELRQQRSWSPLSWSCSRHAAGAASRGTIV